MENVAMIPLRGGSKSIPGKNIKDFAGKPLCRWSIEAAVDSGIFDKVVVSTDCPEIASVVRSFDLDVQILNRPSELATDTATTDSVIAHTMEHFPCKWIYTLQATSPLTRAHDLVKARDLLAEGDWDSLVSGVLWKRFFWGWDSQPINYDPLHRPMRQQFDGWLMENGAVYATHRDVLRQTGSRLGSRVCLLEMEEDTAVELDEGIDWKILEMLMLDKLRIERRASMPKKPLRIIALDVDGTLTDGGMYYTATGDTMRKFHTRDAKGLALLRDAGFQVVWISSEPSQITRARADKLGITHCLTGVEKKLPEMERLLRELGFSWEELCYIGDDVNDLECLERAGLAACPSDADPQVRASCGLVLDHPGGRGAVRQLATLLLEAR